MAKQAVANGKDFVGMRVLGSPRGHENIPLTHYQSLVLLREKYMKELGIKLTWNQFWQLFFNKHPIETL